MGRIDKKGSCGKTVEYLNWEKVKDREENLSQYLKVGALALGINLKEEIIKKFIIYLKMINSYQKKVNITSVQDPFAIIKKHFLDSLSCINIIDNLFKIFPTPKSIRVIDLGSGAGFPGIPVKICLSDIKMVLLEVRRNRTMFLNDVIKKLELTNIHVIQDRAENIGKMTAFREKYHIILSRAVASLNVLCEYCLPLCQVNGVMIAFKGSSYYAELENSKKVIEVLGGIIESINIIKIPYSDIFRYILVIRKIKPTPEEYPRRNGIPQKRPLYFE